MTAVQKTPAWFDQWCRKINTRPYGKVFSEHADILLSDSEDMIQGPLLESAQHDLKWFYRTAYGIERSGKLWFGCFNDYPTGDFLLDTRQGGIDRRIDEALRYALDFLNKTRAAGMYNGDPTKLTDPDTYGLRLH